MCFLWKWRGMSNSQGCPNAVEIASNKLSMFTYLPRLNYNLTSNENNVQFLLKYINAGAGTTGTRSIYNLFCNKWNIISLHYSIECNTNTTSSNSNNLIHMNPTPQLPGTIMSHQFNQNMKQQNKLVIWYNHMTRCVVNPKNQCKSIEILQSLESRLPSILTEYEFISDTPVDMLFIEIFTLMKFQVIYSNLYYVLMKLFRSQFLPQYENLLHGRYEE